MDQARVFLRLTPAYRDLEPFWRVYSRSESTQTAARRAQYAFELRAVSMSPFPPSLHPSPLHPSLLRTSVRGCLPSRPPFLRTSVTAGQLGPSPDSLGGLDGCVCSACRGSRGAGFSRPLRLTVLAARHRDVRRLIAFLPTM
eukprot:1809518-Rhodomonas_salina.1